MDETLEISDIQDNNVINSNKNNGLSLELGDIIEIIAPTNDEINEMTYLLTQLSDKKLILMNVSNYKFYQLNIDNNGNLTDESITEIRLLHRNEEKGFSRQNGLLPKVWVDIHFNFDIPITITGEITNLDEDKIEITTYPDLEIIYIDFAYKGIPEDIPIEEITIRPKPAALKNIGSLSSLKQSLEEGEVLEIPEGNLASIEFTETGESVISIPEEAEEDENIREKLHDMYVDANTVVFGEELEDIVNVVELPEGQQRYGIETQVNDLLDELLSTIPNIQRTKVVLDNIHLLIERFKQLRENFSLFDDNQNVYDMKKMGALYKPLVDKLYNLEVDLKWILPVTTQRKIINDIEMNIETADVVDDKIGVSLRKIEQRQIEYYGKNNNRNITYSSIHNEIQEFLTPFREPLDTKNVLTNKKVMINIESIIDNLGNFYSNVAKINVRPPTRKFGNKSTMREELIQKQRFIIQRYNLGLSKMSEKSLKTGKKIYIRNEMTPNDKVSLKSLIMLPSPVVRFSRIELPMTNIMEKANLHNDYFMLFRLLNNKTDIVSNIIDNFTNEIDYEQLEKDTKKEFLTNIQEFLLSDELEFDDDKYKHFLEVVIPKTRTLIRVIRKYIKDKVSFMDIVNYLEPFMVYSSDISYKQYMEIRYFIKEKINELKRTFVEKSNKFSIIKTNKYNVEEKANPLLKILDEKKEINDAFFENYKFLSKNKENTKLSSLEILSKILQLDNGGLFTNLLKTLLIPLMTPNNLMDILSKPKVDEMTDVEKIKPTDCVRRYLSKYYDSIKSLQKDNNNDEVYYDKEFDDTPYDIMKHYKEEEKKMLADDFLEYLAENLVQKHDCPREISKELASTLIMKKKLVRDGDYAILEIKPTLPANVDINTLSDKKKEEIENEADLRKKTQYYRRLKNNWVHDEKINEEAFIDTNSLFCNIDMKCFKNMKNNICENLSDASARLKMLSQQKLINEFDKRYVVSVEELEKNLENDIEYYRKKIIKKQILNEIQLYKYNNLAYEIGKFVNATDILTSPYLELRDAILGQDDFTKKQQDIMRFVDKFCRYPMVDNLDESQYWFYCIDTNTKLLPIFLYRLAVEFVNGGDYQLLLDETCREIGALSDDGDAIVDKYSGFIIRKIEFSTEEGFDESGFRISTHEIMEKDMGTVMLEALKQPEKPVFENETSEMIYNVLYTITSNIDIPMNDTVDFVMRVSNEIMAKAIVSEASYEKERLKKEEKTGKKMDSYKDYYNEFSIIIIACVLIIRIQTAIPSFQTKKTFPGCLRSFSGYPLDSGVEDYTGLKYIACVVEGCKSSIAPWKSIKKLNATKIADRMKVIMDKYILKRDEINELYLKKREYIVLNPDTIPNEEHSITKWHQYLPPVVQYSIVKKINNISADFHKEFIELLNNGKANQHHYYNIIKSKANQYGYAIMEAINKIVKSKDLLLKTSSLIPFMENACCNETKNYIPIVYFIEEDENIKVYLHSMLKLSSIIKDVKEISKASLLYHPNFTGIKYPTIPIGHLEENVYAAFIHYCNFDRGLPIPESYRVICNEKPAGYQVNWSLQDKKEFLKKNGKNYTVDNLYQLMSYVNNNNLVDIMKPVEFTKVDVMKDIIDILDKSDSQIIDSNMRDLLRNVLNTYNPVAMVLEPTVELNNLKDYLYDKNEVLKDRVFDFFKKNAAFLSKNDLTKVMTFISTISSWQDNKQTNDELYSFIQYMKNVIHSITSIYPTVIFNNIKGYKVPKHWGLSQNDVQKVENIIEKYYESIDKFKGDNSILRLLQEVSFTLENVQLLSNNIPVISPILKDGKEYYSIFDKNTIISLYIYLFYSILNEFIEMSDDTDLINADIVINKDNRRAVIRENANMSNTISSYEDELEEDYGDLDMDMNEIQIKITDPLEFKERICKLLLAFLEMEEKNKKAINFTYDNIMSHTRHFKNREKKSITDFLGNMSKEDRKIEENMKKFKIGRWNVGMQKGLFQYDEATNTRETNDLMNYLMQDMEEGNVDIVGELMMGVYNIGNNAPMMDVNDLEQIEGENVDEFYDNEAFDIRHLAEDYTDGDYYNEDNDEFED
jgi:hypothetical protein